MSLKGLVLRAIVFVALFISFDQLAGLGFKTLYNHAGDKFERENFMRYKMDADIIVMGSSHATHHYVPIILQDSLKMTAYNCGQRGNGIIYEYGRLATIYQRYTPKLIVVDLIETMDLIEEDNSRYLDFLKVDYGTNATVDSLFWAIDESSKYKMLLNCYRYNSTICDLLINTVAKGRERFQKDGYAPLYGSKLDKYRQQDGNKTTKKENTKPVEYDALKLQCLERVAGERPEGSKMVFVMSPTYGQSVTADAFEVVYDICRKNDIPMLNYMNDTRFLGRDDLFYDRGHMNNDGARMFSSIVASDILKQVFYSKN